MKHLSILNWIVFGAGEVILVLCFFLFGSSLPTAILWLDLIVSALAFGIIYLRAATPMIDIKDPAKREVGTLGLSIATTVCYAVAAVVAMVVMHRYELEFKYQLLVQIILMFILVLVAMATIRVSEKVVTVYNEETRMVNGLERLRRQMRQLERVAGTGQSVPVQIRGRISDISSSLRYVTPCNNPEATDIESLAASRIDFAINAMADYELNADRIDAVLSEIENLIKERKNITSL